MNFQQLKFVREAVRQNFNLTEVAKATHATQPGVSRQIKELEDELGVKLFERHGKRLLGLTEPGKQLVHVVERILRDAANLRSIADDFASQDRGNLVVATTHTQARYALPAVVQAFKKRFPRVHLSLHQGAPHQIAEMVASGAADIGISTEALDAHAGLITLPYYEWHHCVLVPTGHPLESCERLTLQELARHQIVTYDTEFAGRSHIDKAFAHANLQIDIVLTAIDADVIKTYVGVGMGVGILASMAYDPVRDRDLRRLPAEHLFEANTSKLGVRRGVYLREYVREFIRLCSPSVSRPDLDGTLALDAA